MDELIKTQTKWTPEKISIVKAEYPLGDKTELAKKLGVSRKILKDAARRFGIRSEKDKNHYKLAPLVDGSLVSFYWLGYVVADGYVSDEGELKFCVSYKDKNHLEKLGNLLNIRIRTVTKTTAFGRGEFCWLTCKDVVNGLKIRNSFKLSGPKTYNPPDTAFITSEDAFISFFIGFFDGDGTFGKYKDVAAFMKIEIHNSWLAKLQYFVKKLYTNGITSAKAGLNGRGNAYLKIYKRRDLTLLKSFILANNLPALERKWNFVDFQAKVG